MSIACTDDTVICWLETLVERVLIQLRRTFGLVRLLLQNNRALY